MILELWHSVSWNLKVLEIKHCRERSVDLGVQLIQVHHFTDEEAKACGGVGGWESCPGSQEPRHLRLFLKPKTPPYLLFPHLYSLEISTPKVLDWSIFGAPVSFLFLYLPSLLAQGEVWPNFHCVHGSTASSCFMRTWGSKGGPGRPSWWVQWPRRTGFNRAELPRLW